MEQIVVSVPISHLAGSLYFQCLPRVRKMVASSTTATKPDGDERRDPKPRRRHVDELVDVVQLRPVPLGGDASDELAPSSRLPGWSYRGRGRRRAERARRAAAASSAAARLRCWIPGRASWRSISVACRPQCQMKPLASEKRHEAQGDLPVLIGEIVGEHAVDLARLRRQAQHDEGEHRHDERRAQRLGTHRRTGQGVAREAWMARISPPERLAHPVEQRLAASADDTAVVRLRQEAPARLFQTLRGAGRNWRAQRPRRLRGFAIPPMNWALS